MFLASTRGRLLILLAAIFLLGALAGGAALMLRNRPVPVAAAVPTSLPTAPLPTPTGLGDATATPVNTPTTAAPPAGQIGVNGWVQVQAAGGLTLRATPGKSGARLRLLNNGIKAHVVEGPKDADGLTWWRVDRFDPAKPDATGWCAGQFLVPTAAP